MRFLELTHTQAVVTSWATTMIQLGTWFALGRPHALLVSILLFPVWVISTRRIIKDMDTPG
jgi:hypothetical protein